MTWLILVPQLARALRVPPHVPMGSFSHSPSVHVCPMYSLAIQRSVPSNDGGPVVTPAGTGRIANECLVAAEAVLGTDAGRGDLDRT